jgi:hypothetical protein
VNLLDAVRDRNLFAAWFDRGDWTAWCAFIAALFGLPLDDEQAAVYRQCTGRHTSPSQPFSEAWLVVGRRGGKSFIAALVAVFLAAFRDYREHLQPGERGTVLILAADRKQARTILRYVRALFAEVPMLSRLVERDTAEGIDLTTRVSIEVHTASFRSVRGYSIVAALLDEVAFWRSEETANPDREIVNALRPGMATVPGSMLLGLSSPYARRGVLYEAWRRHYGVDGSPALVWQAATRTMNPSVPQEVIDQAYDADPASAGAEYGAQFRADVEGYIDREVLADLVSSGVHERPRIETFSYSAFVDPSGGSRDSMTLAIAHPEGEAVLLDAVREFKPPFSPESVVADMAALLKDYAVSSVTGDRYAGEWPREQFRKAGIEYHVADRPKSDLYRDLLPILNSGRADLLDHRRTLAQLGSLERRASRSGKDAIDHAPGAHDDVANAVAGALLLAKPKAARKRPTLMLGGERMPHTLPERVSRHDKSTVKESLDD